MHQPLENALDLIKTGSSIFIQTGVAAPRQLILGLMNRAEELRDITIYQMHTEGIAPYGDPEWQHVFKVNCFLLAPICAKLCRGKGRNIFQFS